MIEFRLYGRKGLEFPFLYTYEELLHDYNMASEPMTLYGGFSIRKTEKGSLICKEINIDRGRLGGDIKSLFSIPKVPSTHIFWFRTMEAAAKFLEGHYIGELVFDNTEPALLEIPKISIFKDW